MLRVMGHLDLALHPGEGVCYREEPLGSVLEVAVDAHPPAPWGRRLLAAAVRNSGWPVGIAITLLALRVELSGALPAAVLLLLLGVTAAMVLLLLGDRIEQPSDARQPCRLVYGPRGLTVRGPTSSRRWRRSRLRGAHFEADGDAVILVHAGGSRTVLDGLSPATAEPLAELLQRQQERLAVR
jgi:hypothetical protein